MKPHTLRLEQVIGNLLDNAIKYAAAKPIKVTLRKSEGRVLISVVDQGIGVRVQEQRRIFERFERAVPERHYGGLGLGLYISRNHRRSVGR